MRPDAPVTAIFMGRPCLPGPGSALRAESGMGRRGPILDPPLPRRPAGAVESRVITVRGKGTTVSHRRLRRAATGLAAAALLAPLVGLAPAASAAAADQSVTLPSAPGSNRITYTGTAPFNNGQANLLIDDVTGACDPGDANGARLRHVHTVDLQVPTVPAPDLDVLVRFQIDWTPPGDVEPAQDLRMDLFGPDNKLVASSDGSQTSEGINVTSATPGVYTMVVCAFQTTPNGQAFTGSVTASVLAPPATHRRELTNAPSYRQYSAPKGAADSAGEPSIGSNWKSGRTLFTSNTERVRRHLRRHRRHQHLGEGQHRHRRPVEQDRLDPIGYTDSVTGRTFVSQLYFACSGVGLHRRRLRHAGHPVPGLRLRHQRLRPPDLRRRSLRRQAASRPDGLPARRLLLLAGAGPGPRRGHLLAQRRRRATFGPPVEIFGGKCNGHPRPRAGQPRSTARSTCPTTTAPASRAWRCPTTTASPGPCAPSRTATPGTSDPSVSVGADGTVYFGYSDGTGRAKVAVSRDKGLTWTPSIDAGGQLGIRNAEFAEVIAGDGDRAAFAFLGTTTPGSTQAATFGKSADGTTFTGAEWHMYVATTFDRGATWTTVDATPDRPGAARLHLERRWLQPLPQPARLQRHHRRQDRPRHGRVRRRLRRRRTWWPAATAWPRTPVSANKLANHGAIVRQDLRTRDCSRPSTRRTAWVRTRWCRRPRWPRCSRWQASWSAGCSWPAVAGAASDLTRGSDRTRGSDLTRGSADGASPTPVAPRRRCRGQRRRARASRRASRSGVAGSRCSK